MKIKIPFITKRRDTMTTLKTEAIETCNRLLKQIEVDYKKLYSGNTNSVKDTQLKALYDNVRGHIHINYMHALRSKSLKAVFQYNSNMTAAYQRWLRYKDRMLCCSAADNNMDDVKINKTNNSMSEQIQGISHPIENEVIISEISTNTLLADIIHEPDLSNITGSPIKCIKIGNGYDEYNSLKSIIILDNSDFIIVDRDGGIIDYITNSRF